MKTAQELKTEAFEMKARARQLTDHALARCLASADECFDRLANVPINRLPLAARVEQEAFMQARRTFTEAIELALKLRRVRAVTVGETTFAIDSNGDLMFLDFRRVGRDPQSKAAVAHLLAKAV